MGLNGWLFQSAPPADKSLVEQAALRQSRTGRGTDLVNAEGNQMKFVLKIAALATACITSAAPAAAQDSVSRTVRYDDLQLNTDQGAAELARRIERAGRRACGEPADASLFEANAVASCRRQAVAAAAAGRDNVLADSRLTRLQTATGQAAARDGG
jgi:UrcA family protein